jgi:DNA-binding transcriptional MerR regulator
VRISELAERVGVPVSTVRYYERIGLLTPPERTVSGYRDYSEAAAGDLLFIFRARNLGLNCDQISELLPVWSGTNCGAAQDRLGKLIDAKRAEIAERIAELEHFDEQLSTVRASFEGSTAPQACRTDLECCVPETAGAGPVPVPLGPTPATRVEGRRAPPP